MIKYSKYLSVLFKKHLAIYAIFLLSSITHAHEGPALLAGGTSFASQFGSVIQISSPLFYEKKWSIQAQWQKTRFDLLEVGLLTLVYEAQPIRLGIKTMLEFFLDEETTRGLHYSFTSEYLVSRFFSLDLEAGFSLGFNRYGTGFSVLLGPKFYFY